MNEAGGVRIRHRAVVFIISDQPADGSGRLDILGRRGTGRVRIFNVVEIDSSQPSHVSPFAPCPARDLSAGEALGDQAPVKADEATAVFICLYRSFSTRKLNRAIVFSRQSSRFE